MVGTLRSLLTGYRHIGVWAIRIVITILAFAAVAFIIVWPLWAVATTLPVAYLTVVLLLLLAAIVVGLHRSRKRRSSERRASGTRGSRLVRVSSAAASLASAYGALVLLQAGSLGTGSLLGIVALITLGIAGLPSGSK